MLSSFFCTWRWRVCCAVWLLLAGLPQEAFAQTTYGLQVQPPLDTPLKTWMDVDSALPFRMRDSRLKTLLLDAWKSIHQHPFSDTGSVIEKGWQQLTKAEAAYKPYEGKYIRKIEILSLGFERSLADTSRRDFNIITNLANTLHTDTRNWAIRQQLFFDEGDPVLPFKIADNERYLRDLRIFQDARILVQPAFGYDDSVDVLIVTKDVFSLRADLVDNRGFSAAKVRFGDDNLFGTAQSLRAGILWDNDRKPGFGWEANYTNYSIAGSFINGTVYYTQINSGPSVGNEDEWSVGVNLDRPLYSQYAHYTGGLEASYNASRNYYKSPDSIFYNYSYQLFDAWLGYNIGANKLVHIDKNGSLRHVLSGRYLLRRYKTLPFQASEHVLPEYTDQEGVLLQLSVFRQSFVKTRFIYGFGVTEDLPVGFNVALTAGRINQSNRNRTYTGMEASFYLNAADGSFTELFARGGSFYYQNKPEDVGLLAGADYFSPLFKLGTHTTRTHLRFSYSEIIRPVFIDSLRLNNDFGLMEFNSDSAKGLRRVSLMAEPQVYLDSRVLGFGLAPFLHVSGAFLWLQPGNWLKTDFHAGLGGGIRARNESLVFNTLELRIIYFPKPVPGLRHFSVMLNSNIRFRYRNSFVHKPDFVQLNGSFYSPY